MLLSAAVGAFAEEVKSGIEPGKPIGGAFNIKCVVGPSAGKQYCQV